MCSSKKWIKGMGLAALALVLGALQACGGNSDGGGGDAPKETDKPTIAAQPSHQTVTVGHTATFDVVAKGAKSYQWKRNDSNIANATASSYTTPLTTLADSGAVFAVVVSNSAGSVNSSNAVLTITPDLVISTQPSSQSVLVGQSVTFTVSASGTAPLGYQWKKNGSDIADATSSSYTTPATTLADSGAAYAVTVSNSAGSVTSSNATLNVVAAALAPTLATQPGSQTVTAGQTASFSVLATGTAPLGYQWKKNGSNIAGATASNYTTPATTLADSGAAYAVTVSNSAGNVTSSNALLTVLLPVVNPAVVDVSPAATGTQDVSIVGSGFSASSVYQISSNHGAWTNGAAANLTYHSGTSLTVKVDKTLAEGSFLQLRVCGSPAANDCSTGNVSVNIGNSQQSGNRYSTVAGYGKEECVKDTATGLIWEGKTTSGTRAGSNTYTNYDSTASKQKENKIPPTQEDINAISNSIGYVNFVNANALCGYTDWRLPINSELISLVAVSSSKPKINTFWFPNTNTENSNYWSSEPHVDNAFYYEFAQGVNFANGVVYDGFIRFTNLAVRLVRPSQ